MEVLDCIKTRRSSRLYASKKVFKEEIKILIEAAGMAPSGRNLQPWRFVIIQEDEETKSRICNLSLENRWLKTAPCIIGVLLDKKASYDPAKDMQAIGAAIQNLLLAAEDMKLSSCWVGGIREYNQEVLDLLNISDEFEIEAIIAVGHARMHGNAATRRNYTENIMMWK